MRVAVAFDHLRSNRRGGQAEALADFLFDFRAQVRAGSYRTRNFPYRHLLRGHLKPREIAAIFGVPVGDFQSERDRLRVDSMRAADFRRVFEFPGAAFQHFTQRFDFIFDQARRFANQQRLRGIHHVVGGEAVMQPARRLRCRRRFPAPRR